MTPTECMLTIGREKGNEELSVKYWDSAGGDGKAPIRIDELTKSTVQRFHNWVSKHDPSIFPCCERDDLQVLGLHLYHILFGGEIREKFDNALKNFKSKLAKNPSLSLRLTLKFAKESGDLATYPWEFIFRPFEPDGVEGQFLAEKTELILTRIVPESELVETLEPGQSPVRILIVSAQPTLSEGRRLDPIITKEIGKITSALNPKLDELKGKLVAIKVLENATFDAVRGLVNEEGPKGEPPFQPHIFHFIGHGEPGRVAFIADQADREFKAAELGKGVEEIDDADWKDGKTVTSLFPEFLKPRLFFLNACSGAESEVKGFGRVANSIARDLVCSGIPAVVAMQYKISNEDAATFAQKVYREIGKGRAIDEAVKVGIDALGKNPPVWSHPSFGTPVFFLQAKDAAFLDPLSVRRAEEEQRQEERKEQALESMQCPACLKPMPCEARWCRNCNTFLAKCRHCTKLIPETDKRCIFCGRETSFGAEAMGEKREAEVTLGLPSSRASGGAPPEVPPSPSPPSLGPGSPARTVIDLRTKQ